MEQALRPHRGGLVLALGLLSVVIPLTILGLALLTQGKAEAFIPMGAVIVPLGIAALVLGWKQIAGMKAHSIDPAGRKRVRAGQVLGIVGALGWATLVAIAIVALDRMFEGMNFSIQFPHDITRSMPFHSVRGLLQSEHYEAYDAVGPYIYFGCLILGLAPLLHCIVDLACGKWSGGG